MGTAGQERKNKDQERANENQESKNERHLAAVMLILKCLTNLHAGDGDVNYHIIDNEVERDPVTNYPTIHASGVKGALKVFLKNDAHVTEWFGAEEGAGKLKILNASMLAMPLRTSQGDVPYCLACTKEMETQYQELCEVFGLPCLLEEAAPAQKTIQAEGQSLKGKRVLRAGGKRYELYQAEEQHFASCALPVLARNKVDEHGKSENLWYEEVVPHKSLFYIPVIAEETDRELLDAFREAVNGKVIQFGGHASIGYGLCKVFVEGQKDE